MGILWILFFILGIPFLLLLVFFALSSCLGDNFRPRVSGVTFNPRHGVYDRIYFRQMPQTSSGQSEQIEMETMLNEHSYPHHDNED